MAFPVEPVTLPDALSGQSNGRLDVSILVDTPGQAGGPTVRLLEVSTRAWRALCSAAAEAGHILKATSLYDSYRPYSVQEATFRARYTTTPIAGAPTKTCNGVRYYQKPGTAMAACPGTSNHGWGLAVDTGEERDGDAGTESIDAGTLAWLVAHELAYGFSHEVQSEPWHIRYWSGDNIPAAVLAYEEDDMTPAQARDFHYLIHRVKGIEDMDDPIVIPPATFPAPVGTDPGRSEPNLLAQAIKAIPITGAPVAGEVVVSSASVTAIAEAVADEEAARLAE